LQDDPVGEAVTVKKTLTWNLFMLRLNEILQNALKRFKIPNQLQKSKRLEHQIKILPYINNLIKS
jgi:hypothetical protein